VFETLEEMIPLFKVFGVFAVVVFMIRMKVPLGISMITGAVLVAFLFVRGTVWESSIWTGTTILEICWQKETGAFVLLIAQVLAISMVLEKSGQIGRLTESLRAFVTNRKLASATLPAIVGFLPMPGGALFSAPMVQAATGDLILDEHKKVEVNHWFRHVWEYSWPLYPGFIYTAALLRLEVKQLLLMMFPLSIMAISMGFLFVMRGVKVSEGAAAPAAQRRRAVGRFLFELSPFMLIIALYLIAGVPLLWSMFTALVYAIVMNLARRNVKLPRLLKEVLTSTHYLNFIVMAYGVMLFGEMLQESGAVNQISLFFKNSEIHPLIIVTALPFIIGFVAGITIVYCMTTFPLLIALSDVSRDPIPYIILAFTAGFMGTMLSPLHACLVLSSQYFKGSLGRVILRLALPAIGVLAMGFALWALYLHWRPF
jgi:integral membrane protein (TIGR00529 family)